jgi:hypothetical protein
MPALDSNACGVASGMCSVRTTLDAENCEGASTLGFFQTGCDQSFLKNIGKIKSRPVDWIKVQHSAVLS